MPSANAVNADKIETISAVGESPLSNDYITVINKEIPSFVKDAI